MNSDICIFPRQSRVSLQAHTGCYKWFIPHATSGPFCVLLRCEHLVGEELQYQVAFSLNLGRARSRLQLEPGVVADGWDLLRG